MQGVTALCARHACTHLVHQQTPTRTVLSETEQVYSSSPGTQPMSHQYHTHMLTCFLAQYPEPNAARDPVCAARKRKRASPCWTEPVVRGRQRPCCGGNRPICRTSTSCHIDIGLSHFMGYTQGQQQHCTAAQVYQQRTERPTHQKHPGQNQAHCPALT